MAAEYITKFRTDQGDKQVDYNALGNLPIINLDVLDTISLNTLVQSGVYTFVARTVDEWADDEYTGEMKNYTMSCYYRVTVSVLTQNQYTTYITQKIEQFHANSNSDGHYWKNCIILRTFNIHHEEQDDGSYINTVENVKEIPLLIDNEPYNLVTKGYVDNKIGDIETALDGIIAIQNELLGVSE